MQGELRCAMNTDADLDKSAVGCGAAERAEGGARKKRID